MKAVFYILIFTLWPSDSKSSRLYEAGFLYPVFLRCRRGKDIHECVVIFFQHGRVVILRVVIKYNYDMALCNWIKDGSCDKKSKCILQMSYYIHLP